MTRLSNFFDIFDASIANDGLQIVGELPSHTYLDLQ